MKAIDRDEMHHRIRIRLAEENLSNEERVFLEMLEDFRDCEQHNANLEKILKKWEQRYLSKNN